MENKTKVVFLGPVGATFSNEAYDVLSQTFNAPKAVIVGDEYNCVPAKDNKDIIDLVINSGGYGSVAMETLSGGRVEVLVESFIELLKKYKNNEECPFYIVGAIKFEINFCLMSRIGVGVEKFEGVFAHQKGVVACKENLNKLLLPIVEVSSNGEGARLVAEDDRYSSYASLAPRSAAKKYGLNILEGSFEDTKAVTTFFLITPKTHKVHTGKQNRALIVFRVLHESGSLVKALIPFSEEKINFIQIHSAYYGSGSYDFAIELDVKEDELEKMERVMEKFSKCVERYLVFGPFEILEK